MGVFTPFAALGDSRCLYSYGPAGSVLCALSSGCPKNPESTETVGIFVSTLRCPSESPRPRTQAEHHLLKGRWRTLSASTWALEGKTRAGTSMFASAQVNGHTDEPASRVGTPRPEALAASVKFA